MDVSVDEVIELVAVERVEESDEACCDCECGPDCECC